MIWHITPVNDLESHEESTTCKCDPRVIYENGDMIVVHNSFDGREGIEWLNEVFREAGQKK